MSLRALRFDGRYRPSWVVLCLFLGLLAAGCAPSRSLDGTGEARELTVQEGESLYRLLGRADVSVPSRVAVIDALGDLYDPASLQPGDRVRIILEPAEGSQGEASQRLRSLHLELSAAEDLTVDLAEASAVVAAADPDDAQFSVRQVSGVVGKSFAASLRRTELPEKLVREATLAFRYDPDTPGKPTGAARFLVVYEQAVALRQEEAVTLRYVELDDGRKRHRVYRYPVDRSLVAFVHEDGQGVALLDLQAPLQGAPVTSPYGWRIHPVLGDRRFHKGVDFGAPKGTPIRAAASGVIEAIGWRGNYGEYLRLRHDDNLETAYAHLSGFARGLQEGSRVERGQIIGYVGSTGLSTGPHLYYEVLVDGEQVDPLAPPSVFPVRLQDADLTALQAFIETQEN